MKIIKSFLIIFLVFSAVNTVYGKKLKLAHVYDTGTVFHKWALWAAEEIKSQTDGKYTIAVYPNSTLGKEAEINEGINLGTIDIIFTGAAFLGRTYNPITIIEAPYLYRDFDHWNKFLHSANFNNIKREYQNKTGNTILGTIYYGVRHTISKKPIRSVRDMKGLKIRVPNAPIYLAFPKATGANPSPIAFSESFLALQSGTVSAIENPLPVIRIMKYAEVAKNITLTGHLRNGLMVVVGKKSWKKLSSNDKNLFQKIFDRAVKGMNNDTLYKESILEDYFEKQGVKIYKVSLNQFIQPTVKYIKKKKMWDRKLINKVLNIK